EDKTSKLTPDKIGRGNLENDEQAHKTAMPEVKTRARQEDLGRWAIQQIEQHRQEFLDDQYLHEAGYPKAGGKISWTQQRRVAAMLVAARVADEMGIRVADAVGYSIWFEDFTSQKIVIKYMTNAILLREFMTEADLAGYTAMIIDESHECTLSTDILRGLVKDMARLWRDFWLIISSATMNVRFVYETDDNITINKQYYYCSYEI
ncbi:hypothetical protein O181_124627, partial [Austropuccinia psidii MF-1]|nr:hypothetical protein [Austropuccinia psidii MF-1]